MDVLRRGVWFVHGAKTWGIANSKQMCPPFSPRPLQKKKKKKKRRRNKCLGIRCRLIVPANLQNPPHRVFTCRQSSNKTHTPIARPGSTSARDEALTPSYFWELLGRYHFREIMMTWVRELPLVLRYFGGQVTQQAAKRIFPRREIGRGVNPAIG